MFPAMVENFMTILFKGKNTLSHKSQCYTFKNILLSALFH